MMNPILTDSLFEQKVVTPLQGYVAEMLADFAVQIESKFDAPLHQIDANAALLLNDLCEFWRLNDERRRQVLGAESQTFVHLLDDDALTFDGLVAAVRQLEAVPA